jgi:hypothetical protein
MSTSIVKIPYSSSVILKVQDVDNRLIGILAPDTSGTGGKRTEVFAYDCDGFAGQANATLDLTFTVNAVGGSPILAMIASNFAATGAANFSITTDKQNETQYQISLPNSYTSEQQAFQFVKQ